MKSQKDNIIIGIDTSCYTTSIAAINLDRKIIFNEKIILKVKKNEKGIRQSEGVFQHTNNLGQISSKIQDTLKEYNVVGICASKTPRPQKDSYMPVFNVGYNYAKLYASMSNCEFYTTTHQENHIEASLYNKNLENKNKFISIHMSGGTTEILLVTNKNHQYNIEIIGKTKDISFGQLIDRVGVKLSYDFPAGKYVDKSAIQCEEKILNGLKTSVVKGDMNVSGVENQIDRLLNDNKAPNYICKVTLDTIVRYIIKSLTYLCEEYKINEVVFAGGVSASEYIKKEVTKKLNKNNIKSYFTNPEYATDNGVGCALIGVKNYEDKSTRNK